MLVLPVYTDETGNSTLWGPANLLLLPWGTKAPNVSLVPLVLPSGDVSDSTTLSATQALAGDTQRLAALAQRYGAAEVLVTEVKAAPVGADGMQSFAVSATRYGRSATTQFSDTVSGDPATLEDLLGQTVDRTINWVQGQVRDANMVDASRQTTMMVDVPLTSLKQWVDIKKQLGGVPSLKVGAAGQPDQGDGGAGYRVPRRRAAFPALAGATGSGAAIVQGPNKGLLRQDTSANTGGGLPAAGCLCRPRCPPRQLSGAERASRAGQPAVPQ